MIARLFLAAALSLAALSAPARADELAQTDGGGLAFDLELDPSAALLKGISGVALVGAPGLARWRFGVDGFTFAFPAAQLEDGWSARAVGGTLLARFYPWRAPIGWWAAAMLRGGRWQYTHEDAGAAEPIFDLAVIPRVGYSWAPRDGRLYLNPQLGLAVPVYASGAPQAGAETHAALSPFPTPALHVGYTF